MALNHHLGAIAENERVDYDMWRQQRVIDNLREQLAASRAEVQRYKDVYEDLPE